MYKVVILSPLPEGLVRMFFSEYLERYKIEANFVTVNPDDKAQILRELEDADIVIGDYTFKIPITEEYCDHMKKVKLIAQPSTGYDHIDVEACKKRGIPVSNIGGANAISVAEHTIALALMLMKRIKYAHDKLTHGEWAQEELMNMSMELCGKNWGIIGLGRIGKEVAVRVKALGANVYYYDIADISDSERTRIGVVSLPFNKLLSESDIISIHVPLNERTRKMIDERALRIMKSTAFFINVSRGGLVDEEALARAVSEGWIAGAGVDVFSVEPIKDDNPLLLAAREGANIILTPHIAGATAESRIRIIQTTVNNVIRVMLGQEPENVVNP